MISRQAMMVLSVLVMISGLFFSRALLSVGIILYLLASFDYRNAGKQVSLFLHQPVLWSMSLLFALPLVSGLWSSDISQWASVCRIKLPLLILPFAFASPYKIHFKNWVSLTVILIAFITAGTVYSMWHYLLDAGAVHESYLQAKTLVTPLENDHVRFSWLVSSGILLAGYLVWQQKKLPVAIKFSWLLLISWFVIYLHILAARTGLLAFYSMCFAGIAIYFFKKHSRWILIGIPVLLLIPLIAYFTLPTFQKRMQYLRYDLATYQDLQYMHGSNDGMRLISIQAGWELMNQAPLAGKGFGDIDTSVKQWYRGHFPQMLESDKIYPSSEWMMYGAGMGYAGLLIFTSIMLLPFFVKKFNRHWAWLMINLAALLSFIFDIGLEVQFGVFIYSFTILWFYTGLGYQLTNERQ